MLKSLPKFLFLLISLMIFTNQSIVSAAILQCEYRTSSSGDWWGLEEAIYYCRVNDTGIFTDARVTIDSVEGVHKKEMTNDNVQGLKMSSIASLKFFPQNLEKLFENLIFISIYSTNLQEIKQRDLKAFRKLKCLQLHSNKITTIDKDLFKFNRQLRAILLHNNQISHIDPNVFDHLGNLVYLWLDKNKCKNALSNVDDSRSAVLQLVERVRSADCVSTEANTIAIDECPAKYNEINEKLHECMDKYSALLYARLNESEKINKELNKEIKNINKVSEEVDDELKKRNGAIY